jgi:transcriptional regulator with XRE-family HTH domain
MTITDTGSKVTEAAKMFQLLVKIRKAKKISQYDIAPRLGISQPTVSQLERRLNPTVADIERYAKAIGVPLALSIVWDDSVFVLDL